MWRGENTESPPALPMLPSHVTPGPLTRRRTCQRVHSATAVLAAPPLRPSRQQHREVRLRQTRPRASSSSAASSGTQASLLGWGTLVWSVRGASGRVRLQADKGHRGLSLPGRRPWCWGAVVASVSSGTPGMRCLHAALSPCSEVPAIRSWEGQAQGGQWSLNRYTPPRTPSRRLESPRRADHPAPRGPPATEGHPQTRRIHSATRVSPLLRDELSLPCYPTEQPRPGLQN